MAGRRILIVDDESYIVSVLSLKFRQAGDQIDTASDGEEGYAKALANLPDLIVSDFQMPVLSGFEMAKRLRENPATAHIPILMLTARGHRLSPTELAQTGVRCVLAKPFSAKELMTRVDEISPATVGAAKGDTECHTEPPCP